MPKSLGLFEYEIVSDIKELEIHKGCFISIPENMENRYEANSNLLNWYSDSLQESLKAYR